MRKGSGEWRGLRARGEKKELREEREREIKRAMEEAHQRQGRKGLNSGMFCTICASQIEREIAMCCWRVSVINSVSR